MLYCEEDGLEYTWPCTHKIRSKKGIDGFILKFSKEKKKNLPRSRFIFSPRCLRESGGREGEVRGGADERCYNGDGVGDMVIIMKPKLSDSQVKKREMCLSPRYQQKLMVFFFVKTTAI